jgi:hypothetical protein
MGTNCVSLLADLFLYSNEVDFIQELLKINEKKLARLAATLYQGFPDRNHKLWNIVSPERDRHNMQVLLECCYIQMESSQWEN